MHVFKHPLIAAGLFLSAITSFASSHFSQEERLDAFFGGHLRHSQYAFRTMVQMGREDAVCALCILMEKHTHTQDKSAEELQVDTEILEKIPTERLVQAYDAAERIRKNAHAREAVRYADLRHFPVLDEGHPSGFSPLAHPYVALLVYLEKCDLYAEQRFLFEAFQDLTLARTAQIKSKVSVGEMHMAVADWSLGSPHKLRPLLSGAYHWDDVCFASPQVFKDATHLEKKPLQTTLLLIAQLPLCLSSHLLKGKKGLQNRQSAEFRGLERAQLALRLLRMD